MKQNHKHFELPKDITDEIYGPDDPIPFYFERNGCGYRWTIPYKNYNSISSLEEPFKEKELLALGGRLVDILVVKRYSINFKQKTGVQKLSVVMRSSESEDKQLLHKLTTGFRANDKRLDKDIIPGTNTDNE